MPGGLSSYLHFFHDSGKKSAIVEYNDTKYAYVHNLQGDIVAILDNNGTAVVQYKYDAWGKPISKTGSMASTLGTVQPFRYRGYVYDEETGLYYLRSRYYAPDICRFCNADKVSQTQLPAPDGNLFCYTRNSPINYCDSDGERPQGHFHSAVLQDITSKDATLVMTQTLVYLSNGRYGYADLINRETGEVWELKRVTASAPATLYQLGKYLKGIWAYAMEYPYANTKLVQGGPRASLSGIVVTNTAIGVYSYIGNGIILYDYVDISFSFSISLLEAAAYNILKNAKRFNSQESTALQPAYSSTANGKPYLPPADNENTLLVTLAIAGGAAMVAYIAFSDNRLMPE